MPRFGGYEIAAPLVKSRPEPNAGLDVLAEAVHAALRVVSARACAGVRYPRRSISHSVL